MNKKITLSFVVVILITIISAVFFMNKNDKITQVDSMSFTFEGKVASIKSNKDGYYPIYFVMKDGFKNVNISAGKDTLIYDSQGNKSDYTILKSGMTVSGKASSIPTGKPDPMNLYLGADEITILK